MKSLIVFCAVFLCGVIEAEVNEDEDFKDIANEKYNLLKSEIKKLNRREKIPSKLRDGESSVEKKRKNIPFDPEDAEEDELKSKKHPIVHAYVSDRPNNADSKKTVIPVNKNVMYDIHDGPNDNYEEVDRDVSRRFNLYPKWFSHRIPTMFGKHFAKRYYHPFGSITKRKNRAHIAHHHRVKTATASRRTFPNLGYEPWMHTPQSWPEAPNHFTPKHIELNEMPKEFMEMQPGRIAPMGPRVPPINLANAVGDIVDIPDGEQSQGLDDDLKEIPHALMKHLGTDAYGPFEGRPDDHWIDYASLPHPHHHSHMLNPCEHQPCLNGGACHFSHQHVSYNFKCNCLNGFSGHYCEHTQYSCHPNPCQHGGLCTKTANSYFCTCQQDYKGHSCEVVSACLHNPCLNNGQCIETADGFYCQCQRGFSGRNCNEKISLCSTNPCANGGTCHEIEEEQRFECLCPHGLGCMDCTCPLSGNPSVAPVSGSPSIAASLTVTTSTCPENACKNGGSCIKSTTGFSCNCPTGFHGMDCATPDLCNPNPCENNGVCVQDGDENYKCICPYGFKGADCQTPLACSTHPCMNGASCLETPDGYHCRCATGYKGKKCTELSPCSRNPCMHKSTCLEKGPMFTCTCKHGYRGKNCREKDPCFPNPCQNGLCGEVAGVTTCNCTRGWMGDYCDIENLCQKNHCVNGGTCVHTLEEFKCICPEGYHGTSCEFRSPCHLNPCENGGICEATGNTYVCRCGAGFHGDRCHLSSHCRPNLCRNGGRCFDGDDDFICECPHGFFGKFCEERRFCFSNPCLNAAECIEIEESFHCKCRLGYFGRLCESNICDPHPCRNGGTCIPANNDIGFACECSYPYHGHKCDEKDPCVPNPCRNAGTCQSHLQKIHELNYHFGPLFHGSDENVVSVVGPIHNETVHHTPYYDEHAHTVSYLPDANLQTNEVNHFHLTSDTPTKVYENQLYHGKIDGDDDYDGDSAERFHSGDDSLPSKHHRNIFATHRKHFVSGYHLEEYPEEEHHNMRKAYQLDYDAEKRTFKRNHHNHYRNMKKSQHFHARSLKEKINDDAVPQVIVNIRNKSTSALIKRTLHDLYVCQCMEGYLGAHCQHLNPCGSSPCRNGGICIPRGETYQCHCMNGFGGVNCNDPHPCSPNPCNNGGNCMLVKSVRGYICECQAGWEGKTCDVQDHCAIQNPCEHGGQCVNTPNGVECKCRARFAGEMCEIDKCADCDVNAYCRHGHCVCKPGYIGNGFRCRGLGDVCSPSPCDNEGICKPGQDGKIFSCKCPTGFLGPRCEFSNPCISMPCLNNGACVDESNSKDKGVLLMERQVYKCFCTQGYRGKNCKEKLLGACSSDPCLHNGTCFDASSDSHRKHLSSVDDYECFCANGYTGKNCELNRYPCYSSPCMNGGSCLDADKLPGVGFDAHGYKCSCNRGFTGRNCEVMLNGPGPCHLSPCLHGGRCVDITNNNDPDLHFDYEHEFFCFCPSQYSGKVCEVPYPACYSMPCLHNGSCFDQSRRPHELFDENGYHCQCMLGYEGKNCEHQYGFGADDLEASVFHVTDAPDSESVTPTPLVVFIKSTKNKHIKVVKQTPSTPAPGKSKSIKLLDQQVGLDVPIKNMKPVHLKKLQELSENFHLNPPHNPMPTSPIMIKEWARLPPGKNTKQLYEAQHDVDEEVNTGKNNVISMDATPYEATKKNTLTEVPRPLWERVYHTINDIYRTVYSQKP